MKSDKEVEEQNTDNPTTESLKRRDRKIRDNGVVEGKGVIGFLASLLGIGVILILVFFC